MSYVVRRALTLLLVAGVVAGIPVSSASSAQQVSDPISPVSSLDRPGPRFPKAPSRLDSKNSSPATGPVARNSSAASTTLPELASTCPAGQVLDRSYVVAGFEDGIVPNPEYSNGWTVDVPADAIAPEGTRVAMTTSVPAVPTDNVLNPAFSLVESGTLMVSLTYRGSFEQGEVGLPSTTAAMPSPRRWPGGPFSSTRPP